MPGTTGFRLHEDDNFHYEVLRSLGSTRYGFSDIKETLDILPKIKGGNFDGWFDEWYELANRVAITIDEDKLDSYSGITIRNAFFRASHYYFVSEFFLHGNWDDERSLKAYKRWIKYFDLANARLSIPGKYIEVKTSWGTIPAYFYKAAKASASGPRPLVILGGGFDSNMEESFSTFGLDALARGYNVIIYEGPGQPRVVREQHVGFIHNWEKVVTPLVDYILEHSGAGEELSGVDTTKIGLLGLSLGRYLRARAAAFEHRLAAVMAIDGVYSFWDVLKNFMPPDAKTAWHAEDEAAFNAEIDKSGHPATASSGQRWAYDHLKFSFQDKSAYKCFQRGQKMTLENGIAKRITTPMFIGDAEDDIFFKGQPGRVKEAVGEVATLFGFSNEQAAGAHCASGALTYQNNVVFEWFEGVIRGSSRVE